MLSKINIMTIHFYSDGYSKIECADKKFKYVNLARIFYVFLIVSFCYTMSR